MICVPSITFFNRSVVEPERRVVVFHGRSDINMHDSRVLRNNIHGERMDLARGPFFVNRFQVFEPGRPFLPCFGVDGVSWFFLDNN